MNTHHVAVAALLLLAACATTPARPALSEFGDIPVVEGLSYDPDRSTIIESPSVKAARFVYRGRIEMESLAISMRKGLEASGWRHLGTATTSKASITQSYGKAGSTLQVVLWEGLWYTYLEVSTTRVVQAAR